MGLCQRHGSWRRRPRPSPRRALSLVLWLALILGPGGGPGWAPDWAPRWARALVKALPRPSAAWAEPIPEKDDSALVQGLKVAYLYNFTRFVQWPAPAEGRSAGRAQGKAPSWPASGPGARSQTQPFTIAVMGDGALAQALRRLEHEGREAQGAPIRIAAPSTPEAIGDSRILFVGRDAVRRLPEILRATAGRPVLLVGDSPGLAGQGVAINFVLKSDILGEGERLRFQIDPKAIEGRGLKVSSQLYDVAEVLR